MRPYISTLLLITSLLGFGFPACAQTTSGPALLDVKEILLQYPRVANGRASDACGLSREGVSNALDAAFKLDNMPFIAANKAKPSSAAQIDIVPEIVTLSLQGKTCFSWIALTAQTKNIVKIPPIETPRSVLVVYWRSGLLVTGDINQYEKVVADEFQKLAHAFAKQYQTDQPPSLTPPADATGPGNLPEMK
jgi:hypothetical protein